MKAGHYLKKIAKGGAIFSMGTFSATFIQFISGIIVIRLLERAEYGLLSFGSIFISMLTLLSTFGFNTGVPRLMAQFNKQDKFTSCGEVAGTALLLSAGMSLLCVIGLYTSANYVSVFFKKPGLEIVFKIMALTVPAAVIIQIFTGIFRGIEDVMPKVLFQDIAGNFARMLLLLLIMVIGLGLKGVLWVSVISVWVAFGMYLMHACIKLKACMHFNINSSIARKLLLFSIPLLGVAFTGNLMGWTGTMLLGSLKSSVEVGTYNAPLRLVNIIPIPLIAMVFLYLPTATRMTEQHSPNDLKKLYESTTKWAFFITLPLLLCFLIDAEFIVNLLLGAKYHDVANILRVLAIGFSFHTFLGPNGMTLIAYGDTRNVFIGTILAFLLSVAFCIILIPRYGAFGAAIGTAGAKMLSNLYITIILFVRFGIHPFSKKYLRSLLFIGTTGFMVYYFFGRHLLNNAFIQHILLFLLISFIVLSAPILCRSLNESDMSLFRAIERRMLNTSVFSDRINLWINVK